MLNQLAIAPMLEAIAGVPLAKGFNSDPPKVSTSLRETPRTQPLPAVHRLLAKATPQPLTPGIRVDASATSPAKGPSPDNLEGNLAANFSRL
jgi:hypothetical protein